MLDQHDRRLHRRNQKLVTCAVCTAVVIGYTVGGPVALALELTAAMVWIWVE